MLPFMPRYLGLTFAILSSVIFAILLAHYPAWHLWIAPPLVLSAALSVLGFRDLVQTKHAVLRNYPILAHLRFLLETSGRRCASTSSRTRRAACRSRATSAPSSISAPSARSTSGPSAPSTMSMRATYEWLHHSMAPEARASEHFRVDHRWSGLHAALFGFDLQHLRHELWRAFGQCHPRPQQGCQAWRLCP